MSSGKRPILIRGGRAFDPASGIDAEKNIIIQDGKIAAIDSPAALSKAADAEVVEANGLLITPGLIDVHVHLREPGQEWKETVATGTASAVAGGFTAVCCMPNTLPRNDSGSVTKYILEKAEAANLARVYPIGCITMGSKGESLSPMVELREAGCVAFSDDGAPVMDAGLMRRALEYNLMLGSVLTVHEEDLNLSQDFSMNESALSLRMGLKGMPDAAENVMIARDIELARLTKGRVHFCHVSTRRGVTLIRRAKEDGIPVTAEVVPHNFFLDETAVEGFNTAAKMSMPLRSRDDVEGVLEGLASGVIDCISTDHAPHERDSKTREFDKASFGIVGLQTAVPLTLAKVREGKLSLHRAIEALTAAPAKCFNLPVPQLRVGAVADISILDPEKKVKITGTYLRCKSKNTPFLNQEMQGVAVYTFVGGVMKFSFEEEFGCGS